MIRSIFLIDDDIDDQELFRDALNLIDKSIKLDIAGDGLDAILKLGAENYPTPDLIFLDLNMPRMDGLTFLAEYRQHLPNCSSPVIMFSTTSNPEHRDQALALGAVTFVKKHNSFRSLCDDLREIIHSKFAQIRSRR